MMNFTLPSSEVIISSNYDLDEYEEAIITDISRELNDVLGGVQLFVSSDEPTKTHMRLIMLNVARYYISRFSRSNGEYFIIPIPTEEEVVFLFTQSVRTLVPLIAFQISQNFITYGIFTEYWEPFKLFSVYQFAHNNDIVLHSYMNNETINEALEQNFEQTRTETLERVFGEHSNHKLVFRNDKNIERDEDNKECQLCCETSDYVCSECHEPLCCKCIKHIKHSTGKCPACQCYPLIIDHVKGGKYMDNDEVIKDNVEEKKEAKKRVKADEHVEPKPRVKVVEHEEKETKTVKPKQRVKVVEHDQPKQRAKIVEHEEHDEISDESDPEIIDILSKCQE